MPERTRASAGIRIAVDRGARIGLAQLTLGGTFCDVYATFRHKPPVIIKVLSVDAAYNDGASDCLHRLMISSYRGYQAYPGNRL